MVRLRDSVVCQYTRVYPEYRTRGAILETYGSRAGGGDQRGQAVSDSPQTAAAGSGDRPSDAFRYIFQAARHVSLGVLPDGEETDRFERKSLRQVIARTADWDALAGDCVAFANAAGGRIYVGIEDDSVAPPPNQVIDSGLPERIKKRVGELTANVTVVPELRTDENGGQYIEIHVPRAAGIASTSKGKFFLRVGDESRPLVGDDVARLINERPATPWEFLTTSGAARAEAEQGRCDGSAMRSARRAG